MSESEVKQHGKLLQIAVIAYAVLVLAALVLAVIMLFKSTSQCYHAYLPGVKTPVNYCPGLISNLPVTHLKH